MTRVKFSISCSRLETWMTGNRWSKVSFRRTSKENYAQTKDILVRLCLRTFFLMAYSLSLKLKTIWRIHRWVLPTRFCLEKEPCSKRSMTDNLLFLILFRTHVNIHCLLIMEAWFCQKKQHFHKNILIVRTYYWN